MAPKISSSAERSSLVAQLIRHADQPFVNLARTMLKASFLFSYHPERAYQAYDLSLAQVDVLVAHVAVAQRPPRAVDQAVGNVGVKSRRDDPETPARAIRLGPLGSRVDLHEAATSSNMCPSFARLVSM